MLSDADSSPRAKLAIKLQTESKKILSSCREFCVNSSSRAEDYIWHVAQRLAGEAAAPDTEGGEALPELSESKTLQTLSELSVAGHGRHEHAGNGCCGEKEALVAPGAVET